jgi:hypothetical protein
MEASRTEYIFKYIFIYILFSDTLIESGNVYLWGNFSILWILTALPAHAVGITSVGEFVLKTMKKGH